MSDINYDTNAIRSSFQNTNYLIRFCIYLNYIALLKALMDFYSLTIFTYNTTRKKFDSKFIFMIVLTTLTAMTTKQFNLVPFCRSSFCAHIHTVQKIYYVPITFSLYLRNRLRNNVQNQDINEK